MVMNGPISFHLYSLCVEAPLTTVSRSVGRAEAGEGPVMLLARSAPFARLLRARPPT